MGNLFSRNTVSKEEFNLLKNQIESQYIKNLSIEVEKDMKIKDLEEQIKMLGRQNKNLSNKHRNIATTAPESIIDFASEEQIRLFVEELLTDEQVNIEYLPDWVERKLYINVFNILIGLIKKTVQTSSIDLIGHKIKLDMKPK